MTDFDQSLPNVPPGIDPEVQAKIDTLLAQHPTAKMTRTIAGGVEDNDSIGSYFGPTTALPLAPSIPRSTLFKRAISYIAKYFSASPTIIEYPDAEIKKKTQVCVKAQKCFVSSVPTQGLVVKVAAVLTESSPTGVNVGEYGLEEKPVEILAKHKRVREIKRGSGCYVVEHAYRKEIRVALARLSR